MMTRSLCAAAMLAVCVAASPAQLLGGTTYQGRLIDAGQPALGAFDIDFVLFEQAVGGTAIASQSRLVAIDAGDGGVFTVNDLVFGPALVDGRDLWLEVRVAPDGGGPATTLTPRQPLTATPRASYAAKSGTTLQDAYDNGRVIEARTNEPVSIVPTGPGDLVQLVLGGVFEATPQVVLTSPTGTVARLSTGALALPSVPGAPSGLLAASDANGSILQLDPGFASGDPARRIVLNTALVGDASVRLPVGAIGPSETLAEAGVSEGFSGLVTLNGGTRDLFSAVIVPPAEGFVLALLDYQVALTSSFAGELIEVTLGLNDGPAGAANRGYQVIGSGNASVTQGLPLIDLFEVTAGDVGQPFEVFVAGRIAPDVGDLGAAALRLVYIPTSYAPAPPRPTARDYDDEIRSLKARVEQLERLLDAGR